MNNFSVFFTRLCPTCFLQSEVQPMSEAQAAQRDDSPMDVDQPSPLEQDPAPLGMTCIKEHSFLLDFSASAVAQEVNVILAT